MTISRSGCAKKSPKGCQLAGTPMPWERSYKPERKDPET